MSKPRGRQRRPQVEVGIFTHEGAHDAVAQDINRATERIGGPDARKRAQWLIETFLPMDPATLSTGSHIDRSQELFAFVYVGLTDPDPTLGAAELTGGTGGHFADANLRLVWRDITERVVEWATGKTVKLPPLAVTVERRPNTGRDLRARITPRGEGAVAAVYAVFDLLAHPDVRVRVCPECHKLFVPVRRQERHPMCARKLRDSKRPERGRKPKKGGR